MMRRFFTSQVGVDTDDIFAMEDQDVFSSLAGKAKSRAGRGIW